MTTAEEDPEPLPVVEPVGDPIGGPPPEPQPDPLPDTEPLAETARELEQLEVDAPRVAILMSAESEMAQMEEAERELSEREILSETRVMSPDDEADLVADYARNAKLRGLRVLIAAAGLAPALPAVVAGYTELPVIGVPLTGPTPAGAGLDALLSGSPAPPHAAVAYVGVDNARNAAVLAARILEA